jgi:hypothetical protein
MPPRREVTGKFRVARSAWFIERRERLVNEENVHASA